MRLTPCRDARALLARTTLVIAATTAATPVLPEEPELLAGKHFISIGSFKPAMQELPDAVYKLAGELAIDSEAARQEVGDVLRPLAKGILTPASVFWIGDLISGRAHDRCQSHDGLQERRHGAVRRLCRAGLL